MPKAPAGVELQVPPECQQAVIKRSEDRRSSDLRGSDGGFMDLGNGTKVRVGGQVRAETGFRH